MIGEKAMQKEQKKLEKKLTEEEVLRTEFDTDVEVEEDRENLGWGLISSKFLIITG